MDAEARRKVRGVRYEVYTLRRTSSRTVYAIYDHEAKRPVCYDHNDVPVTTTDRALATSWARLREREAKSS